MRTDLFEDLYITEETHWWHKAKRRYIELFFRSFIQRRNLSILDVGCGTGKNMEELTQWGDVWGIDKSSSALSFCWKRNIINVKKGEAEKIPFDSGIFDVVCALDVLEHVDDVSSVREIKKTLKENGYLIITVPAFKWLWSQWDEVLHHKRRYTTEHLVKILKNEGFIIKRCTYVYSFLVIPMFIIRFIKQQKQKTYTSDFQINNSFINFILSSLSKLEQWWINRYDMPFGTSVLCIAQKNPQKSHS